MTEHDDPTLRAARRRTDPVERFWAKVNRTDSCWLWTGAHDKDGYGKFRASPDQSPRMSHRYAYELLVGPIPEGYEVDHLCRVKGCVRPDHLEPVPKPENMRRAPHANREKTHCPQGHPYDVSNTYLDAKRRRFCRTCNLAACRRYRDRKAAAK